MQLEPRQSVTRDKFTNVGKESRRKKQKALIKSMIVVDDLLSLLEQTQFHYLLYLIKIPIDGAGDKVIS